MVLELLRRWTCRSLTVWRVDRSAGHAVHLSRRSRLSRLQLDRGIVQWERRLCLGVGDGAHWELDEVVGIWDGQDLVVLWLKLYLHDGALWSRDETPLWYTIPKHACLAREPVVVDSQVSYERRLRAAHEIVDLGLLAQRRCELVLAEILRAFLPDLFLRLHNLAALLGPSLLLLEWTLRILLEERTLRILLCWRPDRLSTVQGLIE